VSPDGKKRVCGPEELGVTALKACGAPVTSVIVKITEALETTLNLARTAPIGGKKFGGAGTKLGGTFWGIKIVKDGCPCANVNGLSTHVTPIQRPRTINIFNLVITFRLSQLPSSQPSRFHLLERI
jgi:hypothetical protein